MGGTPDLDRFRRFLRLHELVKGGTVVPQEPQPRPRATPRVVRGADAEGLPPVLEAPSPDGRWFLTEAGHQLAIREAGTDTVRQLTTDGTATRPWRVNAQSTTILPTPPVWAPDGGRVVSLQAELDRRPTYPVVDWLAFPFDIAQHPYHYERAAPAASGRLAIIDVLSGAEVDADVPDGQLIVLHWTDDADAILALGWTPTGQLRLLMIQADTGATTTLASDDVVAVMAYLSIVASAASTAIPGSEECGWASDRDGDLRLYAVPLDGGEPRPLTPPGVQVRSVVGAAGNHVILLAHSDQARPYDVHICRTDRKADFAVLTQEPGVHEAVLTADDTGLQDAHSSLIRPPRTDLLRLDGTRVATLATADITGLDSLGRAQPEEFVVTAADGVTPLHGVLYLPCGFDPTQSYPVIDSLYGGPQTIVRTGAFVEAPRPSGSPWTQFCGVAEAFTQLGFVGIALDGRGTPGRGRDFQAAASQDYPNLTARDHAAAIHALAAERPWIDASRCGAIGISFGGYHAARCGLVAPEVFKAVVAVAAPLDLSVIARGWYERLLGTSYAEDPQAYAEAGLVGRAAEYQAELLLIHGTHDVNVPLAHTMRFSDALVRAGKHHELLVLNGQGHQLTGAHGTFALEAAARFLTRHLRPPSPERG